MGTRNGICIVDPQGTGFPEIHEYFEYPGFDIFRDIRIYTLMEDHNGKIWVGTGKGVYILDVEKKNVTHLSAGNGTRGILPSNLVYDLMEDSDHKIWIASSEGVCVKEADSNSFRYFRYNPDDQNSLANNFTISLAEDKLGYIWIGSGIGLNRYDKKKDEFLFFSSTDGLPSNIIYDIIIDKKDNLWFSTSSGVAMLDPVKAESPEFIVIPELLGKEFNIRAVFVDPNNNLYFGSMDGLYSFNPDSLVRNKYIPPVTITSIVKESDEGRMNLNASKSKIEISHKDYSLTISYAALDYTDPERNLYSYRMKGISEKWIAVGNRRFVHFTNLSPGDYHFEVKGSNSDGVINPEPASLEITIHPPWWLSTYALIAYAALLLVLIFLIIRGRERKLLAEKKNLEIKVQERTEEISLQKERLIESEQKLSSTINSLDDLVFVLDEDGVFQEFYNPRKRTTHRIFPELHIGKKYDEVDFPEEVILELNSAFLELSGKYGIREFDHELKVGSRSFWYNTKISPRRDSAGNLSGFVIVARDITDRKLSEAKLKKQKEELKELNATKDKFFSILAHDLKNPFTNLYSMSQLLVEKYGDLDNDDRWEAINRINSSAELISRLLENLLTWSRTQRNKLEYRPEKFNLAHLVETNINLHRTHAQNKSITLNSDVKNDIQAFGDREMIDTVLRNLISNAIKFTKSGGNIGVYIRQNNGLHEVKVEDNGIGINTEDLQKLFRIDVKYKSRGAGGETGTGLGLALCKEFIGINQGQIWCESAPGKGSRFYFTIPTA